MLLLQLSPLATVVAFVKAAPASLANRAADPPGGPIVCGGGPPCVSAGLPEETCIFSGQVSGGFAHGWIVTVPGDTLSNDETLGGGLLDNLRGQCGVITDWRAEADDANILVARFSTTIFCGSDDVHNALWLANGKNYEAACSYTDNSWDSINWSSGFILGLQGLFDLVGIVVPRT